MGKNKLEEHEYEEIFEKFLTLEKQSVIADRYNVSKERVRQIINSFMSSKEKIAMKEFSAEMTKEKNKARDRARYQKKKEKYRAIGRTIYYKKSGGRPRSDMWTKKEDFILEKYYPIWDIKKIRKKLNRSRASILARASLRGIKKTYNIKEA